MKVHTTYHPVSARALVALALALAAALAAVSVAESDAYVGERFTVDGIEYEVTDEGSHQVSIIWHQGSPEHVSGTVSYGGAEWTVVSVGENAFNNCYSLQTADLPSATYVGNWAFYFCESLTTADLPLAASVGDHAFSGCGSLTTADLSSATYVGDYAFDGCIYLTTADLRSAASVGDRAFRGCESLTSADLPSATSVGDRAFDVCDALTFARFSDELESVGSDAFLVFFYSGSERLSADAGSLRGRTFTGDGDGSLYESYEISWLDDSGALADTTFARKGDTPSHDGQTKEPTDRYTYEFAGWSPEPGPAYGKASYAAVFDAAARAYPVTVGVTPDGYGTVSLSEVAGVPYGTALPKDLTTATISVGGTEVTAEPAEADSYVYSFVRWEASGLVDGATGTRTSLTAVFDRSPASGDRVAVQVVVAKASGSTTSMSFRVAPGTVAAVDGTSLALGGIRLTNPVPQDDERYAYSFSGWTMDGVPLPDGESSISGDCSIASSIVATERSYEVTIDVEGSGTVSKGSVVVPYRAPVYAEGRVLHVGDEAVEATPAAPGEDSMPVFLRWEVPSVQVTGPMTATAASGSAP